MAKRPSLSANLSPSAQHGGRKRPFPTAEPEAVSGGAESIVLPKAARSREEHSEITLRAGHDSLMDIVGQAIAGMSIASYITWHQTFVLHSRLSSYLLQFANNPKHRGAPPAPR